VYSRWKGLYGVTVASSTCVVAPFALTASPELTCSLAHHMQANVNAGDPSVVQSRAWTRNPKVQPHSSHFLNNR